MLIKPIITEEMEKVSRAFPEIKNVFRGKSFQTFNDHIISTLFKSITKF
jgi:hypothetical protein